MSKKILFLVFLTILVINDSISIGHYFYTNNNMIAYESNWFFNNEFISTEYIRLHTFSIAFFIK